MRFLAVLTLAILFLGSCNSAFAQSELVPLLLDLPAPPAANKYFNPGRGPDTPGFFDHRYPPHDDAPIDEILLYWKHWNEIEPGTAFTISPNIRVAERILGEIEDDPGLITGYLNVLSSFRETGNRIRDIFEANKYMGRIPSSEYGAIKAWVRLNTDSEIEELAELAGKVTDQKVGQPENAAELLAVVKEDWELARPLVDKLDQTKSSPMSTTLGHWIRYRKAVDVGNTREADRNRVMLQRTVEDREAKPEVRNFALSYLAQAGDFPDKDEWYLSLLADEALSDIELSEKDLAGLTSFIVFSAPERYVDQMVFLSKSPLQTIRNAAVRNLAVSLENNDPRAVRALVPWLFQKDWAGISPKHRALLVSKLQTVRDHESVAGLLALLEETDLEVNRIDLPQKLYNEGEVKRVKAASDARRERAYVLRLEAVRALGNQRDSRAVESLYRTIPDQRKQDRADVVRAILRCGGFAPEFQLEALEREAGSTLNEARKELAQTAKRLGEFERSEQFPKLKEPDNSSPSWIEDDFGVGPGIGWGESGSTGSKEGTTFVFEEPGPFDPDEIMPLLQSAIVEPHEASESFLNLLLNRLIILGDQDPVLSLRLRQLGRDWFNRDYNSHLLKSLSNGIADTRSVVRLLNNRKLIRDENVLDLNRAMGSENPESRAVAACVKEDPQNYAQILYSSDESAKSVLFACARLIRAKLSLEKSAESIASSNRRFARAASSYLESEDSPEAARILYGSAPNQALIVGSKKAFGLEHPPLLDGESLKELFVSTGISSSSIDERYFEQNREDFDFAEEKLRRQIIGERDLIALYWYEQNLIKVFENRTEYIWADDPARYWTRTLTESENANFLSVLAEGRIETVPAFLGYCEFCEERQLVFLNKTGGRRVYFSVGRLPEFAANLDRLFAGFRRTGSELHYWAEKKIPSIEILFGREDVGIIALKKVGGRYLAAVQDIALARRAEKEIERINEEEEDNYNLQFDDAAEKEWRRAEREKGMPLEAVGWYELAPSGIGSRVEAPPHLDSIDKILSTDDDAIEQIDSTFDVHTTSGLMSFSVSFDGIYENSEGKQELIRDGWYANPIINVDKSAVLILAKEKYVGSSLLLMNVKQNFFKVIKPPSEFSTLFPERYIPQIGKFLVLAGNEPYESSIQLNYQAGFLVDPVTGSLENVSADLIELLRYDNQDRQYTRDGKRKWAALRRKNGTSIVQYDPASLNFKEIFFVHWIRFSSDKMIINNNGESATIAYNGHLLQLSLK